MEEKTSSRTRSAHHDRLVSQRNDIEYHCWAQLTRFILMNSETCRRRHVKCDEQRPKCGPCIKARRDCGFLKKDSTSNHGGESYPSLCHSIASPNTVGKEKKWDSFNDSDVCAREASIDEATPETRNSIHINRASTCATDDVSIKWLDLLVENFLPATHDTSYKAFLQTASPQEDLVSDTRRTAAALTGDLVIYDKTSPAFQRSNIGAAIPQSGGLVTGTEIWHTVFPITLRGPEIHLFGTFVDRLSHWVLPGSRGDHFSTSLTILGLV